MESVMDSMEVGSVRVTRSKRKKRKAVLGIFPRFLLIVVGALVMTLACYMLLTKIMQPYKMQRQQAAQIRTLTAQIDTNNSQNAVLQSSIKNLQQTNGIETAARDEGYLKPGEISLEVKANSAVPKTAQSKPGFSELVHRAWSHLMQR